MADIVPERPDPKKVFEAEIECLHGMPGPSCAMGCRHPENWLFSNTKKGPAWRVIQELISRGILNDDIELVDPGLKRVEHYSLEGLMALTGVAIVGGHPVYKDAERGPTLGLRLIKVAVRTVVKKR